MEGRGPSGFLRILYGSYNPSRDSASKTGISLYMPGVQAPPRYEPGVSDYENRQLASGDGNAPQPGESQVQRIWAQACASSSNIATQN